MSRRPSPLLRATRALIGLVTIWCLGCSGYEPIVESLAFGTAMRAMTDVAHEGTGGADAAAGNSESVIGPNVTIGAVDEGFDCCGSGCCHLVFIDYVRAGHIQVYTLRQVHELPDELTSVSRAPLIPPPQRTV
ncbi:MAG: hypothetical protein H7Z40_08870 [Phycisphaerae bacterium]|nr:hypothetical protein [Gemmatimonadaceae bacterium]